MATLDIPVSVDVQKMLDLPECIDMSLPKTTPLKVMLPTGSAIQAFTDMSQGIPTDCSLTFSLLVQVAPLLGSMECLLRILKLLKPLIDVISGLPFPPVKAITDFAQAAADLAPCLLIPTPAGLCPFIKSLLQLIVKVLRCFLGQLQTIVGVLGGLSIQINAAQADGNTALLAALNCARDNAQTSAQGVMNAMEPIGTLLDLVGPVMAIAGQEPIKLPAMAPGTDIEALNQVITTVTQVVDAISVVADNLPC